MRLVSLALLVLLASCSGRLHSGADFADAIAAAHGSGGLYDMPPLQFHLTVEFGGERALTADGTYDARTGRVRFVDEAGGVAVFDGQEAWLGAFAIDPPTQMRFHLLTWPYFLAAPWKLGDPGARLATPGARQLAGAERLAARMTFGEGIGDTPDDWYVVYADSDDSHLIALAYVVTYGKSLEEAQAAPHAATYDAFEIVNGLRLPTHLTLWNWSAEAGLVGEPLGTVQFSDLRFGPVPDSTFAPPAGAQRVPAPR